MKTLLKVLGILALLAALVTCGLSITRNMKDANDSKDLGGKKAELTKSITEIKAMMDGALDGSTKAGFEAELKKATDMMEKIPSTNTFYAMAGIIVLMLLISLYCGVLFFKNNTKTSTLLLVVSIILFVALYFISPDIETGEYGPAAPRKLALACGIPVALCALFAFLISKMPSKNTIVTEA